MLMDTHRIEGIKFNFDRLSDKELTGIRDHLLTRHARIVGEIALVESYLQPDSGQLELDYDQVQVEGFLYDGRDEQTI